MSMIFYFKQKTASEVRISDWSSDVCSSDLSRHHQPDPQFWRTRTDRFADSRPECGSELWLRAGTAAAAAPCSRPRRHPYPAVAIEPWVRCRYQIGRASWRERVCQYVYISGDAVSLKKNT